jgi:hypothetical protein
MRIGCPRAQATFVANLDVVYLDDVRAFLMPHFIGLEVVDPHLRGNGVHVGSDVPHRVFPYLVPILPFPVHPILAVEGAHNLELLRAFGGVAHILIIIR